MKNSILILFISLFLSSCNNNKTIEPSNKTPSELLSLNAWQLDRYTDVNGKTLGNSSLNVSALAIYGLLIEFRENKETRALDKITKNILNRGTWDLLENNTVMDINITGFKGQFKVVSISTGKLIIQATTGNFLSGIGETINLEFSEGK